MLETYLRSLSLKPFQIRVILKALEGWETPVQWLQKNPYQLIRFEGIGFGLCDTLALAMGLTPEDPRRLTQALLTTLERTCETQGYSCIDRMTLQRQWQKLLALASAHVLYERTLSEVIADGKVYLLPSGFIAPIHLYEAEQMILMELRARRDRMHVPFDLDLEPFIARYDLGEQQRQALDQLYHGSSTLLLIGYAGTGKSTTTRALLDLLATRYHHIMGCALSGIATQRLSERSGHRAHTIASLLSRHEEGMFPYDVLVLDEFSMINSVTFAQILSKLKPDALLILVGDDAQLPPIGAGNPLRDSITLDLIPRVTLTHIYRQSAHQALPTIANAIRQGEIPAYSQHYDDFRFLSTDSIAAVMAEVTLEFLPASRELLMGKAIKEYLSDLQILTPMRQNDLGTLKLNTILQEYFNPNPKQRLIHNGREVRLWDKVIHVRNENMLAWDIDGFKNETKPQKRRIYNGMCGLLFQIQGEDAYVFYPTESVIVGYHHDEIFDLLDLAYALTIHKAQGMEYERVILIMSLTHHVMLNTQLLYTALTRAKQECILIGDAQAFELGASRTIHTRRKSLMGELLTLD